MEIYICYCCGYPIIFRVYGGSYHQPIHLPTGWPCWQMQQAGECDGKSHELLQFPSTTSGADRMERLKTSAGLYNAYLKTNKMKKILGFVKNHLRSGKSDVVRDLLEYIVDQGGPRGERDSLVNQIIVSDGWKTLHQRLVRQADRQEKQKASTKKKR